MQDATHIHRGNCAIARGQDVSGTEPTSVGGRNYWSQCTIVLDLESLYDSWIDLICNAASTPG